MKTDEEIRIVQGKFPELDEAGVLRMDRIVEAMMNLAEQEFGQVNAEVIRDKICPALRAAYSHMQGAVNISPLLKSD